MLKTNTRKSYFSPETCFPSFYYRRLTISLPSSWKRVSFKPSPASNSLLDEAVFDVSTATRASDKRKSVKSAPDEDFLDIQLTPMFEHTDKPELMELTLEVGMSVHVLQ